MRVIKVELRFFEIVDVEKAVLHMWITTSFVWLQNFEKKWGVIHLALVPLKI